jgi:hypothetical protein
MNMPYGATGGLTFRNDRILLTRPDRNEITVLDRDGQIVMTAYGATPLQPVTEAMREEFRDASIARDPSRQAEIREYFAGTTFPEVVPAFAGIFTSLDGHMLVLDYEVESALFTYLPSFPPRTDPRRFTLYDPDGVLKGKFEVPRNFGISEIGSDYILGITTDELGVQRASLHSLTRY